MTLSISTLFTLIVTLLVLGILVWLAFYVTSQFPMPEPIGRIIRVIIVVIAVLILVVLLLNIAGVGTGVRIGLLQMLPMLA